jgi:hypothetical protein
MKSSFALLACLVVLAAVGSAHASTTCLDENGNPVDWWYGPPPLRVKFRSLFAILIPNAPIGSY